MGYLNDLNLYDGRGAFMSKQSFDALLADFRASWVDFSDHQFNIKVIAFSSIYVRDGKGAFDQAKYICIGEVAIPLNPNRPITPDGMNSTLHGFALVERSEDTAESVARFCELSRRAGAALPESFYEQLSGLCHWDMNKAESNWLALLVYLSGQFAVDENGIYHGEVLLINPYLVSIRAIEKCALNSGTPLLPSLENVCSDAATRNVARDPAENDLPRRKNTLPAEVSPPLEKRDVEILELLARRKGIAAAVADLSDAGGPKTVAKRLEYLERLGYVGRPEGKMRNWIILPAGEERLKNLPAI
jgi:hypothetical protein